MITSSQGGKAAELIAAAMLICGSNGRLSPFAPLADDHGVDLIAHDKLTGGTVALQVKSWLAEPRASGVVQFDVRKATFAPRPRAALLAMVIDRARVGLEVGWVIPFGDVAAVSADKGDRLALTPSRDPGSGDRYARFRRANAEAIAAAIIALL